MDDKTGQITPQVRLQPNIDFMLVKE